MQVFSCSFLKLLGRILIAAIFLIAGIGKLMDPNGTAQYMAAKGLSHPHLLLYISAILEVVGGLSLIFGFWTRIFATILLFFLTIVTLVMHNFWDAMGAERTMQMIEFLKNLGILGGLLYIIASGPGKFAFCHNESCTRKEHHM